MVVRGDRLSKLRNFQSNRSFEFALRALRGCSTFCLMSLNWWDFHLLILLGFRHQQYTNVLIQMIIQEYPESQCGGYFTGRKQKNKNDCLKYRQLRSNSQRLSYPNIVSAVIGHNLPIFRLLPLLFKIIRSIVVLIYLNQTMIKQQQDPKLLRTFKGHKDEINTIAFHPQCKQIATGSNDSMVFVWNLNSSGNIFKYIGHRDAVTDVKFSPLGNQLASASKDETVKIWTNNAEGNSFTIKAHNAPIRALDYSYDGKLLLTCSDDKTIKVHRIEDKKLYFTLTGHKNWIKTTNFSPDNRLICSGGEDKTVILWDTQSQKILYQFNDHLGSINDCKFNSDGTCLASCSTDKKVKLYDLRCKRLIQNYDAHGQSVTKVDFHPKNNFLMTTSLDSKIKIWEINRGVLQYTLYGHNGSTNTCAFSKYGDYFATGGSDSLAMIWKTNLENEQTEFIQVLDGPKTQPISKVKSTNKLKNATNRLEQDENTSKLKLPGKEGAQDSKEAQSPQQVEIPAEVEEVVDKISQQLNLIIKSLLTMEERVSKSEERISKLNMVIFKRLSEKRNLKKKIMNLEELENQELKVTIKHKKHVPTEEEN